MESEAAFVRTEGGVELDSIAAIDAHLTIVMSFEVEFIIGWNPTTSPLSFSHTT
jgi:hypothetical protein